MSESLAPLGLGGRGGDVLGALGCLSAVVRVEDALAEAKVIRRDLDQFIVGDVLYRALDGEVDRRGEQDRLVRAGRTHVVEMLG